MKASRPSNLGPHGGPVLETESGVIELSVFERGVPPVFRLFFSNQSGEPQRPPPPQSVTVVTTRPDGDRQTFGFRAGDDFLESTSDIPEPHEFLASVGVIHDGHEHRYETQFIEAGHGHAHGHDSHGDHGREHGGHSHDHSEHDHDHGTGLLGWFRGTFAHSHSTAD